MAESPTKRKHAAENYLYLQAQVKTVGVNCENDRTDRYS